MCRATVTVILTPVMSTQENVWVVVTTQSVLTVKAADLVTMVNQQEVELATSVDAHFL